MMRARFQMVSAVGGGQVAPKVNTIGLAVAPGGIIPEVRSVLYQIHEGPSPSNVLHIGDVQGFTV